MPLSIIGFLTCFVLYLLALSYVTHVWLVRGTLSAVFSPVLNFLLFSDLVGPPPPPPTLHFLWCQGVCWRHKQLSTSMSCVCVGVCVHARGGDGGRVFFFFLNQHGRIQWSRSGKRVSFNICHLFH